MSEEKKFIYPDGIRCFPKKDKQPDFVYGTVIIEPKAFFDWVKAVGEQYFTEYNGKKQIRFDLVKNKANGAPSFSVDTFKPNSQPPAEDNPF